MRRIGKLSALRQPVFDPIFFQKRAFSVRIVAAQNFHMRPTRSDPLFLQNYFELSPILFSNSFKSYGEHKMQFNYLSILYYVQKHVNILARLRISDVPVCQQAGFGC